ncbi:MAG: FtsK/SpoIIIE domain-containing protein, partial [Ktedonobacteraceae bacterium]
MTRQNWQQLLAALVALIVLALMWQIWQLIAPAFKAMAPVLAWTLLIAGVIIIVALTIGVVGAVVVFLRERHVAAETKLIEASKMPANERGFVGAYIDKSRKGTSILMPQVSAYSVETPGHVHIQTDNSNKGGPGGSADGWRERFAWAKLEWDKEKQAALNAGPSLNLLPSPRPTIEEIVEELSDDVLEFSPGKSLTTQKLIKVELRGKHIKVIGGSQMGKTSLIGAIIQQVCLKYSIAQLRLVVLDLEDVTGLLFEDDPHILEMKVDGQARKVHARNPEQVAQMLTWLDQVMLYRYELVHSRGLAYVDRLPRILIYFEEFLDWKKTLVQRVPDAKLRDDAIATINALSTRGLKVGMHLMVAAQVDYADPDLLSAIAQFVGINLAFCVKPTAARSA